MVIGLTEASFGVIEEALVTQSLFNRDYLGLHLLDFGYVPALGIGSWWTLYVLGLHTLWSTAVPIALVESLTPGARRTPWLGRSGVGLIAFLFVIGCLWIARLQPSNPNGTSTAQLLASAIVVVALVAAALVLGRRTWEASAVRHNTQRLASSPPIVGATAFACGSAFMAIAAIMRAALPAAVSVTVMLAALSTLAVATLTWSRRSGWSERHRLAVAGGLLLT